VLSPRPLYQDQDQDPVVQDQVQDQDLVVQDQDHARSRLFLEDQDFLFDNKWHIITQMKKYRYCKAYLYSLGYVKKSNK